MAERRMFTKRITDDDHFMALSSSAQALYLHLSMSADDDGFCNQVSLCMFKAHASVGDLEALLSNRYIYQFESGVIVIKHWRMANALRKDRYTPTVFKEEFAKLKLKDNESYTLVANRLPSGCQVGAECLPQDSIGEVNEGEDISSPRQKTSVDDKFDTFWKAYPRKVGKGDARKKFEKALKHTDFDTIMTALGKQKQSAQWKRDGGQFVPHPSTWLNQERWDDEVDNAVGFNRNRSRNTILNYQETGVSHASTESLAFDLEEL